MEKIQITLIDGSKYSKLFTTSRLRDQFVAKLELFEGLFFDITLEERCVKINPKFIVKIEQG